MANIQPAEQHQSASPPDPLMLLLNAIGEVGQRVSALDAIVSPLADRLLEMERSKASQSDFDRFGRELIDVVKQHRAYVMDDVVRVETATDNLQAKLAEIETETRKIKHLEEQLASIMSIRNRFALGIGMSIAIGGWFAGFWAHTIWMR